MSSYTTLSPPFVSSSLPARATRPAENMLDAISVKQDCSLQGVSSCWRCFSNFLAAGSEQNAQAFKQKRRLGEYNAV